jgi:hypothetical protein
VQFNDLQIDKLKEDEQASDATRALLVQSTTQQSHGESQMVHSINQKHEISEAEFISRMADDAQLLHVRRGTSIHEQDNLALKNQVVQVKEINKLKTSTDSIETGESSAFTKATQEVGRKRKFGELVNAKNVKQPALPSFSCAKVDDKILPTGATHSESECKEEDEEDSNVQRNKTRENSARVRVRDNQSEKKSSVPTPTNQENTAESPEGKVITRNRIRSIGIVLMKDAAMEQDSASESDENGVTDLVEENGKDMVNIPIISLFQADGLILVNPHEVKTQVYCNDTIRTLFGNGEVDPIAQIRREPLITTVDHIERWESGDGEASEAYNMHEAIEVLEQHARNPKVNGYLKSIMTCRKETDRNHNDDDILNCTDLFDMFTSAEAHHNKYDMHTTPIWALPDEVASYTQRIYQQYQIGQGPAMIILATKIWLNNMENLFIDHVWFCQDAALWYEQHVQDLDINRLHNEMIGNYQKYMWGDVTYMETYIKYRTVIDNFNTCSGSFLRKISSQGSIEAMHEACFNFPDVYHQDTPIWTSPDEVAIYASK